MTWITVTDFPRYQVNELGELRYAWANVRNAQHAKVNTYVERAGYEVVAFCQDGKSYWRKVHRVVFEAFHGAIAAHHTVMQVNHINGIKTDNRLTNLELITAGANVRHAIDVLGKQMATQGSKNHFHKLKEDQVRAIRAARQQGQDTISLAAQYGITRQTIYDIMNGKSWSHLT